MRSFLTVLILLGVSILAARPAHAQADTTQAPPVATPPQEQESEATLPEPQVEPPLQQQAPSPRAAQRNAAQRPSAATPSAAPDTTVPAGPPPEFAPPPAERPLRGVAWQPPEDLAEAERQLEAMKAIGAEAVRTPLLRREALLTKADSLRLRLFQDLPATYLSGEAAMEELVTLRWELERALLVARRHPSARHFGLMRQSDTSVPATCTALRALAADVRAQGPPGASAYYESPFVESDRCTGATQIVLLDALGSNDPQALLQRWRQARADTSRTGAGGTDSSATAPPDTAGLAFARLPSDSVAVGLGALGTWVNPDVQGLRAAHSPQAQARYFETHLPALLRDSVRTQTTGNPLPDAARAPADSTRSPAVVFAYRWSDAGASQADDPYGRRYGLHDADGQPRPALGVVRGLYTGQQAVFAFDQGEPSPARTPWLVLAGWGLFALLGVAYAGVGRFREVTQRYFTGRSFYRDAVHEGRRALGISGGLLLVAVGLCAGLVVTVFLLAVQETGPFVQMLRGASGETQGWVLMLVAEPWLAVLIVAVVYLGCLAAWALFLSLATWNSQPLSWAQALALVAWPRWPAFFLAVGAIVATTLSPGLMLPVSGALVVLWLLASLYASARTLYDLAQMASLSPLAAPFLIFLNPLLIAAVLVFFAVLGFLPEATYLWHLAGRT